MDDATRIKKSSTQSNHSASAGADTAVAQHQSITSAKTVSFVHDAPEPMPLPTIVTVGMILKGRFVIDKEIARGGMGVVFRARDLRKEQFQDRNPYIAIKVLGEEFKARPDSLIALQRESGKAQKLAHPNIVTVYDFDSDEHNVFMTMEYLEGESLERFIAQSSHRHLSISQKLAMIVAMGQGLAYAHEKDIVHCDFKPGNVFLTKENEIKILDFGIARAARQPGKYIQDATRFDAGSLGAYTPAYASCEMMENTAPDPRDDIYALACVAYELFTGKHPFNRLPATIARDSHLKATPIKGLAKSQWKALLRGLSFHRAERPASVQEFLRELKGQRETSSARIIMWVTLAIIAVTVAIVVVLVVPHHEATTKASPVSTTAPATQPSQPVILLTSEQQKTVERLLEAAEIHFMVNRITEPEGSNAYEAYKHILEIDPSNAQAKLGIQKIADHYESVARQQMNKGDKPNARISIQNGLQVMPQHSGLNKLKEELEDRGIFNKVSTWIQQFFK